MVAEEMAVENRLMASVHWGGASSGSIAILRARLLARRQLDTQEERGSAGHSVEGGVPSFHLSGFGGKRRIVLLRGLIFLLTLPTSCGEGGNSRGEEERAVPSSREGEHAGSSSRKKRSCWR
jgi:hypothetical protein